MDKRNNKSKDPEIKPSLTNFRIITLILLTLGGVLFSSCKKNDLSVINNLTQVDTLPSQTIQNLTTIYMDTGRVQMIIKAPMVNYYTNKEEPVMIFPEGIHVNFFNRKEKIETHLQAGYAIYYQKKDLWEAHDSVIAENSMHEKLNAEILFWDVANKQIYSDKFVRITTPDEIIFGEGFKSDQAFNDWNINHVRGTVYIKSQTKKKQPPKQK